MIEFSAAEWADLHRLRDQYRAARPADDAAVADSPATAAIGSEPVMPQSGMQRLIRAAGILVAVIPLGIGEGGVTRYHCQLMRHAGTEVRALDVQFQVMPAYPTAPDAEELLTWIAGAVASGLTITDLSGWGLVFGIVATGRTACPPYRGLFYPAADLAEFVRAQRALAAATRAFLGPAGFAALLREAGCELDSRPAPSRVDSFSPGVHEAG